MLGDLGISYVRTLVPLVAEFIITLLVNLGIELDEEASLALSTFLMAVFSGLWYIIARWLEDKFGEKWGFLLGIPKKPTY